MIEQQNPQTVQVTFVLVSCSLYVCQDQTKFKTVTRILFVSFTWDFSYEYKSQISVLLECM
jgi:hypothetical protein